jgi:hypothetical protein
VQGSSFESPCSDLDCSHWENVLALISPDNTSFIVTSKVGLGMCVGMHASLTLLLCVSLSKACFSLGAPESSCAPAGVSPSLCIWCCCRACVMMKSLRPQSLQSLQSPPLPQRMTLTGTAPGRLARSSNLMTRMRTQPLSWCQRTTGTLLPGLTPKCHMLAYELGHLSLSQQGAHCLSAL